MAARAEEGAGAAKAFTESDGLFEDVDAVLHRHPGSRQFFSVAT